MQNGFVFSPLLHKEDGETELLSSKDFKLDLVERAFDILRPQKRAYPVFMHQLISDFDWFIDEIIELFSSDNEAKRPNMIEK